MKTAWVRLALVCIAVVTAAVAVGGGIAGNRDGEPKFDAVPGPGRVTYGENIAYRAAFTNSGGSTFTQVAFRMTVPKATVGTQTLSATFVSSTCPSTPTTVQTSLGTEWVCTFGKLTPGTSGVEQVALAVVWKSPTPASTAANCANCLVANGRWVVKEGVNDQADPNDAFPPGGKNVSATLLATGADSAEKQEAGGYELPVACTDALGAGSLRTKQAVSLDNKVSTTVCIPTFLLNGIDLGLATTILESDADDGNPAGHAGLGSSAVCIAALGQNCGAEGSYTPFVFATPVKFVFRISGDALAALEKKDRTITQVFHNGQALPQCPSTNANGCYTSITQDKKTKDWLVQAEAKSNGLWGW